MGSSTLPIAIAGAGMAGAYLYRLLRIAGIKADLFDPGPATRCGIAPCAWGTSRDFNELVRNAGLDPQDYILTRHDHLVMDGIRIRARLLTFDKPKLIRDLLRKAYIRKGLLLVGQYARVIDATGVRRAFLPPLQQDATFACVQYRIRSETPMQNRIQLGHIGYAWCFPLANQQYHVGCGSFHENPARILDQTGWLPRSNSPGLPEKLCSCRSSIRLTGPHRSQPFFAPLGAKEGIWGIGEAIGCVAPLAGDGVVTSMQSARLLIEHWDSPDNYSRAVLKTFNWMQKERAIVDKLTANQPLTLTDALVLKKNSKRMDMQLNLRQAAKFLSRLR